MTISRSDATILALWVLVVGLVAMPLLLNPYLPFEDLPNHIARRYIATTQGSALDAYFTFRDAIATNAAVDLAWRIMGPVAGDPVLFSRWTMGFATVGFVLSVAVLHRMLHGHWSLWPLVSALLVYNANVLWGFENFVVTAPLGILGLALWIVTRNAGLALRLGSTLAVVVILYLGHVLVLLCYALLVFGYEAGMAWRQARVVPRGLNWTGLAVVAGACLVHLALMASEPAPEYGTATRFGTVSDRLQVFMSPFGSVWAGEMMNALVRQGPYILGGVLLLLVLNRRIEISVRLALSMRMPLLVLGLVCLLMPMQLSGVYFTHLRFPFILLGVAIAATDPKCAAPWLTGLMVLLLVALVATRSFILDRAAQTYSSEIADLEALSAHLPTGARVLPIVTPAKPDDTTLQFHTAAYLVPFKEVFVATLFVGGSHSLGIAPQWKALTAPQPSPVPVRLLGIAAEDWTANLNERWGFVPNWQKKFTHLLVIGKLLPEIEATLPAHRIASSKNFVLLAVGAE